MGLQLTYNVCCIPQVYHYINQVVFARSVMATWLANMSRNILTVYRAADNDTENFRATHLVQLYVHLSIALKIYKG